MSDLASWGAKLRGAVAHTRAAEAQRTLLFEQRANRLYQECYERLLELQDEGNAALRGSSLILRLTRGQADKLAAWLLLEVCQLDAAGAPMDTVKGLRIVTSVDNLAVYDPPAPELPPLDLDDPRLGVLPELLATFIIAGLRAFIARP